MKTVCKRMTIAALILGLAFFVLIQTDSFQQWVLRRAEVYVRDSGFAATAAHLRLDFSELRVTLDGVAYDQGGQRIEIERLDLDLPWYVYRNGEIRITSVEASGVVARLQTASPQPTAASGTDAGTKARRIHVDRIAIRNGSLTFTTPNTVVAVPSISVEASDMRGIIRLDSPVRVGTTLQVVAKQVPFQLLDDRLRIGPVSWSVLYGKYDGGGSIEGEVRLAPTIALTADVLTHPLSIAGWKGIQAAAGVSYSDGVFEVRQFRATQAGGEVSGSARISDAGNSANVRWKGVRLDRFGLRAGTHGTLNLKWKASDFGDVSGQGDATVNSREYGTVHSKLRVSRRHATFDVRGNPMDAAVHARITAGVDGQLRGSYQAVHRKFGVIELRGTLGGTVRNPAATGQLQITDLSYRGFGPATASASGTFRNKVLRLEHIDAALKGARTSGGTIQVDLADRSLRGEIPWLQTALQDFNPDVRGTARLNATISGTIDAPSAQVSGCSDGMDFFGTPVDSVCVSGQFLDKTVQLTQLEARQSDAVLVASATLNMETAQVHAEATVSDFNVVQIPELSASLFMKGTLDGPYRNPNASFSGELRRVKYKGVDHGNIIVEGTADGHAAIARVTSARYSATAAGHVRLEAPYFFSADIAASKTAVQYGGYEVVADGGVRLSGQVRPFDGRYIRFDKFRLTADGVEISADGSPATGARVSGTVDLSKVPIKGVSLQGNAEMFATVSGTMQDPIVEGSFRTDQTKLRTAEMREQAGLSAELDFTGRDFSVRNLTASYAGATATVTGHGSWQGKGHFGFRVDNVRPENFVTGRPVSGLATVVGEVEVKNPSVDGISARLRVPELTLKVRDVEIRQSRPIEASFNNQTLKVESLELEGLDTRAVITGTADLRDRSLNFNAEADTDLTLFEAFLPNGSPDGRLRTRIALRGTPDNPVVDGSVTISNGALDFESPDLQLTGVEAEGQLRANHVEITRATGKLNGGDFEASGEAGISAEGLREAAISMKLNRTALDYPKGLQSEVSAELMLSGAAPTFTLSGNVDVLDAIYQEDLQLARQVLGRITTGADASSTNVESGLADRIRMEVDIRTQNPVIIDNNVADLELTGSFRVRGTASRPIILGRAVVLDGGELYFGPGTDREDDITGKRPDRYVISRGAVDFTNSLRTEPDFDFLATHELKAKDETYLVTLTATGTLAKLKTELTSDPPLSRQDIVTMLLTGRTFEELQGAYATVAGEQALNYLSGQISEQVLSEAGNILGLNTVRLDPVTVADTTDLAARLTIGKDITPDFRLAYSQILNDAKAQTWTVSYDVLDKLTVRGINDTENQSLTFDLRHDLQIGGGPPLSSKKPRRGTTLDRVTFSGTRFPEEDLRKHVTRKGQPVRPNQIERDARNLRRYFASNEFPSAQIQVEQTRERDGIAAHFSIVEGPRTSITYAGWPVPDDVKTDVERVWMMGRSEPVLIRTSTNRLLRHLRSRNYLQAQVSATRMATTSDHRQYLFKIEPGYRFETPKWLFHGIEPIDIPEDAGTVMENPEAIANRIETHLRNGGYLDATSTAPRLVVQGMDARFEVTVDRGKQYVVGEITFEGAEALSETRLRNVITPQAAGSDKTAPVPLTSQWLETARQRIVSEYWNDGFNNVEIVPSVAMDAINARSAVAFKVNEGDRQVVEAIEIDGAGSTRLSYVRRQFEFGEGDAVNYEKVNLTRKNLYDTRLFKRVEIEMSSGQSGYVARVHLNENAPWRLRYGIAVTEYHQDDDRELGFSADLSYNNLFGRGVMLGTSAKANPNERDARVYSSVSGLLGKKENTSVTIFATRSETGPDQSSDYWGGTVQQQWKFGDHYVLSYDYSYRGVRTEDLSLPRGPLDENPRIPIARFNTFVSRDTRNDILNAARGSFVSNSFEFAPAGIGSSIEYISNYAQFLRFRPVIADLVWASGFRLGMAKSLDGQALDPTTQFVAGGGTTVRGFRQDQLSEKPGNSLLLLNQEMRFPIFWKFGGAGFLDIGQVGPEIRDLARLSRLRYGAGVGLRLLTPFLLLRADYGVNLFRREGEPKTQLTFGIGQAF
jgi:outer membrane protein assembly factor BamA/autotransporter translocation and assembly factor TamB